MVLKRSVDENNREISTPRAKNGPLIEVISGVAGVRSIRTALVQLAYSLAERRDSEAFLVLPEIKITRERLEEEWRLAASVLQPAVASRLNICIYEHARFAGISRELDSKAQRLLAEAVPNATPGLASAVPRADASFVTLKVLLHHWLTNGSPVTTDWLARTSGYSYPTIANVLRSLGGLLERQPDRRIRLRWFPRDQYARLAAVSDRVRSTVRFADSSGQPRSPEAHIRRLEKLAPAGVAVGGVLGAKHYLPALDLVGTPRLDLSVHCPDHQMDLGFVAQLDPALKPVEDPLKPANLVVHAVRHAQSLFTPRAGGLAWADPLECLLDLQEAHLEAQAAELLQHLQNKVKGG
jgi:hypothetical protein